MTLGPVSARCFDGGVKKLVNDPADVVRDARVGLALAHPGRLRIEHDQRLVLRAQPPRPGKVGIVSGGGSGHEPLHSGYVGPGMLDAACCGEIFTSPVPDQILAATRAVDAGAGVLHIVKNYTGDVLNFEMAAEIAAYEGLRVASVVVDDDVAVTDSLYTAGRRGVGLTVLLQKILGAAAEQGRTLDQLVALAEQVIASGRSFGVALTSCTVPTAGRPTFELGSDEIELGIGIHGEPGRERARLGTAADVAETIIAAIMPELEGRDEPMVVLVNGMGGTPLIELYVMFGEVARLLEAHGITIARSLVGNHITALEMSGCSVTFLRAGDEMLALWDAPVNTPGLRWGC